MIKEITVKSDKFVWSASREGRIILEVLSPLLHALYLPVHNIWITKQKHVFKHEKRDKSASGGETQEFVRKRVDRCRINYNIYPLNILLYICTQNHHVLFYICSWNNQCRFDLIFLRSREIDRRSNF